MHWGWDLAVKAAMVLGVILLIWLSAALWLHFNTPVYVR